MSANDHLQQAQYLLNFYDSDTPLREEYDRDTVRALRSYRSQFSELPINNPSLPYGDLLEKSSKQLKAILHKWSTAEEHYSREDTSTTTGGPSNRADELTEAARRDREENLQESEHNLHEHNLQESEHNDSQRKDISPSMGDQTISLAVLIEALQMNAGMVKAESIKTSDLGFFYPDAPISWGSTNMFVYDGKTYYRDAHTFTTRLKNLCSVKNWKNVKAVVDTCFMGTATTWWNITIDQDRRLGLLAANNEDRLILALQEKFKPPPSESFNRLTTYSIHD